MLKGVVRVGEQRPQRERFCGVLWQHDEAPEDVDEFVEKRLAIDGLPPRLDRAEQLDQ